MGTIYAVRLFLLCLAIISLNGKIKQYSSDYLKKMYIEFIKIVQCIDVFDEAL